MNWYLLTFISTQIWSREMVYVLRLNCQKCQEGQVYAQEGVPCYNVSHPERACQAGCEVWSLLWITEPVREGRCMLTFRYGNKWSGGKCVCFPDLPCFRWWWGSWQPSPALTVEWMAVSASFWLSGQLLAGHQKWTVWKRTVGTQSWPLLKCMHFYCKQWLPLSHDCTPHIPSLGPF